MAFEVIETLNGASPPIKYGLLTDNEGCTKGQLMKFVSGRLTDCDVTDLPDVVALKTQAAEATSVTNVPYHMVTDDMVFKTKSTATVAATLVGAKVTLHTDSLSCTATTTSGVFEITKTDGATTNSTVRGRFRE